ncbi:hypothetical protein F6X37_25815 [Paraburkholderia sp. 31.1]|uniref:hypothetical protein n=1 Tax=Paraburkholderia sp. 31.1 TaxID=2615205 RepID=UPI001654C4FC|nr:hypothetical protein [Paraburkholderia sp. 31.1]MBC8724870.1 hypothetical protein [Paraburkholderia sp. 31.1]
MYFVRSPTEAIRNVDFIVEELHRREPEDPSRIGATRVALRNQRNNPLAFAGGLDQKLGAMDRASGVSDHLVRATCLLHRKPDTSSRSGRRGTGCTPPSATSSTISTGPCRRLDDEDSADCQRETRNGPINTDPDSDGECKHDTERRNEAQAEGPFAHERRPTGVARQFVQLRDRVLWTEGWCRRADGKCLHHAYMEPEKQKAQSQ